MTTSFKVSGMLTALCTCWLFSSQGGVFAQYNFPHPEVDSIEVFATDVGHPAGIAIAEDGDILIGDFNNPGYIRKATPDGDIEIFATDIRSATAVVVHPSGRIFSTSQDNTVEYTGPGGGEMLTFADGFDNPSGMTIDLFGNLYVADHNSNAVLKVTADGAVHPFASGLNGPVGMTTDACGNLYVSNRYSNSVSVIDPFGVVDLFQDSITSPHGLAFDGQGNLFVAGTEGISVITPAGTKHLLPGTNNNPTAIAFDGAGRLYVSSDALNQVLRITFKEAGGIIDTIITLASGFSQPAGLVFHPNGYLLLANFWDPGNISAIAPNGAVSLFAAGGGRATAAIARDSSGYLYGTCQDGTLSRVPIEGGTLTPFITDQANPAGVTTDGTNYIYIVNNASNSVNVYSLAGSFIKSISAEFNAPTGCVLDEAGNLYVANRSGNSITRIHPDGSHEIFAEVQEPHTIVFDAYGNMFAAIKDAVVMISPNGVVTFVSNAFNIPTGLAFDGEGNLYVASFGGGYISKVIFN